MSSSVSSLSAALAPAFTGVSKFGTSLQSVLTRAVAIASLPLDGLNAGLTTLTDRQSALNTLDSAFASLQRSVNSIQHALNTTLLSSSVSDGTILNASLSSGAAAGTYSVEVTDLGAYSTAVGIAGTSAVSAPSSQGIGNTVSLTLNTGGSNISITAASTSLADLAAAINSQAGNSVQATLVNAGSTSTPDYRLSLRAVNLGAGAITLADSNGLNLIASSTNGSLASYLVGGLPSAITSDTRSITLAPGVTVNLTAQSAAGKATTITIADSPDGIASAFSSFAQAYNNAVAAVNQNHGQNGGPLRGDSILQSLSGVLSQLGAYDNGTPASALANYGITLDKSGNLSVDTSALSTSARSDFPAFLKTLGSTTGAGFLKKATTALNNLEDSVTGSVPAESSSLAAAIAAQQTKIANEQALIASIQTGLTKRISQADTAIAALESRVSYVTGLFAQYTGASNTQSNGLSTL